jgi:hypothetical protein
MQTQTLAQARTSLAAELRQAGWKIAKDAMAPLEKIDFAKLVQIHDHEEHFLRHVFVQSLVAMRQSRAAAPGEAGKITAADVETAIRMVGVAAQRQEEATLSKASISAIKDSCGFCK